MEINESPVFLRLDPTQSPGQKDLPVWLYESGARRGKREGAAAHRAAAGAEHQERGACWDARAACRACRQARLVHPRPACLNRQPPPTAELHVVEGVPSFIFVPTKYTLEVSGGRVLLEFTFRVEKQA